MDGLCDEFKIFRKSLNEWTLFDVYAHITQTISFAFPCNLPKTTFLPWALLPWVGRLTL